MRHLEAFFIISAARENDNATEQKARHDSLRAQLEALKLPHDTVEGSYKGTTEPAFIVLDRTPRERTVRDAIERLAREYNQESILAVGSDRSARLIFTLDTECAPVPLGHFRQVTEYQAKRCDAWTRRNGLYYVAGSIV